MMGATGAVGTEVVKTLLENNNFEALTLLGRRPVNIPVPENVYQNNVDIFNPDLYSKLLENHQIAICTLGVGQPSKISKADFIKIDKQAVLDFSKACKEAGVTHFQLLSSVGIDANSRSFFLKVKGELVEEIKTLNFERFSIFQPSMILTPTNRYGFSQALTLKAWPLLSPLLIGKLKSFRGIKVASLGKAIALNVFLNNKGIEYLKWSDFHTIIENSKKCVNN